MPRIEDEAVVLYRGDYAELPVTLTQSYHASAELHFAAKLKEQVSLIDATDTNAVVKVDADNTNCVDLGGGKVKYTLIFTEAATTGKTPGTYVGELEYIDGAGNNKTLCQFTFILKADVNQRS